MIRLTRRRVLKSLIGAMAGTVLARMPLVGPKVEVEENFERRLHELLLDPYLHDLPDGALFWIGTVVMPKAVVFKHTTA